MLKKLATISVIVLLFCGCTSLPQKRVTKLELPAQGYSFYSGDEETLGDIWSKETILTHQETGKEVTLLGMYHIADKEFYRYVQQKIDASDVVLAEGISGKSSLSLSTFFYTYMFALYERGAHWQRLSSQGHEIQIPAEKYVHADISMTELEEYSSWGSTLGQVLVFPFAALAIEPSLLLSDLSDFLHFSETDKNKRARIAARRHTIFSQAPELADDTEMIEDSLIPGVITPRNAQLLKIIDEQVKVDGVDSVLVPWGAAHLQDIENKLAKKGYKVTKRKWLRTISAKGAVDSSIELSDNRVVNLPYLYTYYRYPKETEHNLLFQLLHLYSGDDYHGFDLGYGQIMCYQSSGESSYFSLLPSIFGRPLLFDYTRVGGEVKINALLFLHF